MTDQRDRPAEPSRSDGARDGSSEDEGIEHALSEFVEALEETWERTEFSDNPPRLDVVDPIGEEIAHYRILRQLGAGAWARCTRPRTRGSAGRSR